MSKVTGVMSRGIMNKDGKVKKLSWKFLTSVSAVL